MMSNDVHTIAKGDIFATIYVYLMIALFYLRQYLNLILSSLERS